MMKYGRSLVVLGSLAIGLTVFAQGQLKELSLEDAILKAYPKYSPERPNGLQWIEGTSDYCFVKDSILVRNGVGKSADRTIMTLADINAGLPKDAQLKRFPPITWENANTFRFEHFDRIYEVDGKKRAVRERMVIPDGAEDQELDPTGKRMAYTKDNDLYITVKDDGPVTRVTRDGGDGIVNGKSVHRQEYGITKGTFWSPDGTRLAFYRMDETMVTPYFLEDIGTRPSTFDKIRYPMAGQASHQVTIGVFDLASGRTTFLQTGGPADQYLTNIAWGPDGKRIHVVHLERNTEDLRLVEYDAATGAPLRTLLSEHDDRYLEPEHPMTFLAQRPDKYIWWSDRDGWDHLYLYSLDEGLERPLTMGNWNVKRILGEDRKGGYLYVEGTGEITKQDPTGALSTLLYRVDLRNGGAVALTTNSGEHSGQWNPVGGYLLDSWSSTKVPGRFDLLSSDGTVLKTVLNSKDPLAGVKVGSVELLTLPGANGDLLNARIVKPHDFDPGRRYPVLVYLYNGPHVRLIGDRFIGGAQHWMLHAAERGYIVFTVDGHGSADRGRDFEQIIHRRLGTVEMEDQLMGVEYLKGLPYVDVERMAVHGWSFGGFMTTTLMTRSPGTFLVGVGGGPVIDWNMYEVMYTERYMDTPAENPDGYANAALPDKCGGLSGSLLLIHGGKDDVVLPEHSYAFLKSCVEKGEQLEFFVYPGHGHNVRGKDRLHLMTKVLDHIDRVIQP